MDIMNAAYVALRMRAAIHNAEKKTNMNMQRVVLIAGHRKPERRMEESRRH